MRKNGVDLNWNVMRPKSNRPFDPAPLFMTHRISNAISIYVSINI